MAEKEIRLTYRIRIQEKSDPSQVAIELRKLLARLHKRHGLGRQVIQITTKDNNE